MLNVLNTNMTPRMRELMAHCYDRGHRLAHPITLSHFVPDDEDGLKEAQTTLPKGSVVLPIIADETRVRGFCEGFWVMLQPGDWTMVRTMVNTTPVVPTGEEIANA